MIDTHIRTAIKLRDSGDYEAALALALITVAARSRQRYPHPTHRDSFAFPEFLFEELKGLFPQYFPEEEEYFRKQSVVIYKMIRCALFHEGAIDPNHLFQWPLSKEAQNWGMESLSTCTVTGERFVNLDEFSGGWLNVLLRIGIAGCNQQTQQELEPLILLPKGLSIVLVTDAPEMDGGANIMARRKDSGELASPTNMDKSMEGWVMMRRKAERPVHALVVITAASIIGTDGERVRFPSRAS